RVGVRRRKRHVRGRRRLVRRGRWGIVAVRVFVGRRLRGGREEQPRKAQRREDFQHQGFHFCSCSRCCMSFLSTSFASLLDGGAAGWSAAGVSVPAVLAGSSPEPASCHSPLSHRICPPTASSTGLLVEDSLTPFKVMAFT